MSQKGVIPLLIVIILAALVGGYLVYQRSQTSQPTQVACTQDAKLCPDGTYVSRAGPNCEFAPCPNPEATSSADTANWKTYTDENKEFSFQYRPYLKMVKRKFPYGSFTDLTDMSVKPDGNVDDKEILYSQDGGIGSQGLVYIEKGFSLTAYRQQQEAATDTIRNYRSGFENAQKISVDNREAYKVTRHESGGGYEGVQISVYIINKEKVYVITTNTFLSSKVQYLNLFDQILSTFRFTQ